LLASFSKLEEIIMSNDALARLQELKDKKGQEGQGAQGVQEAPALQPTPSDGPVNTAEVKAKEVLAEGRPEFTEEELRERRETRVLHRFCSYVKNSKIHMPNGIALEFREGLCHTDDPEEIKFLTKEVRTNPHIYTDPNKLTVVEAELDPEFEVLNRMRERVIRELGDSLSDEQRKILAGSTRDMKVVIAGSTGNL
jgi:hypothetical protein